MKQKLNDHDFYLFGIPCSKDQKRKEKHVDVASVFLIYITSKAVSVKQTTLSTCLFIILAPGDTRCGKALKLVLRLSLLFSIRVAKLFHKSETECHFLVVGIF